MELLLDVLLISVNSQIKLYFKKWKLIFHDFMIIPQTVFKFNIIHAHSFYFMPLS